MDQHWRIIPGLSSQNEQEQVLGFANPQRLSVGDFGMSRCVLSGNEVAALVSFTTDQFGVQVFTSDLKIKWSTPVPGVPRALGRFHNKLLVLTTSDFTNSGWKNDLDACILDPETGKIEVQKNVYQGGENYYIEPKFFFSSKDNDFKLGIRTTGAEKKFRINVTLMGGETKLQKEWGLTSSFELISFNDKLEATGKAELPVKKEYRFLDCKNNSEGVLFIAYFDGESGISVQRVKPGAGNSSEFRHMSFDAHNNSYFSTYFFLSPSHPDIAYMNVNYFNSDNQQSMGAYKVDFGAEDQQPLRAVSIINKDYKKKMKEGYTPFSKDEGKPTQDDWSDLKPTAVLEQGDKIIVVREVLQILVGNGREEWTTGDMILSFYDKEMKLQSELMITKDLEQSMSSFGRGSSLHVKDNVLYILTGKVVPLNFHAILASVDLTTGKLLKYAVFNKNPSSGTIIDPQSTIWFNDGAQLNFLAEFGVLKHVKVVCHSEKISY